MLKLDKVHAFYGKSHVLHGVHFEVRDGEIVALLGRNGSGRSTTVIQTWILRHLFAGILPWDLMH